MSATEHPGTDLRPAARPVSDPRPAADGRPDANAEADPLAGRYPGAGERVESIDIARIMQAIPHRYPFLMIDRVVELVRAHSAIGVKNVSVNDPSSRAISPTIR